MVLVEREDFGAGTLWNSLKMIDGGMADLQKLDLRRPRESARQRVMLLSIAPEIVPAAPVPGVPTYGHGATGGRPSALGLLMNDWLTRDRNRGLPPSHRIPGARTVGAAEALRLVPGLERRGLSGAALWHDAQAASTERAHAGGSPTPSYPPREPFRSTTRRWSPSCSPRAASRGSRCATRSAGARHPGPGPRGRQRGGTRADGFRRGAASRRSRCLSCAPATWSCGGLRWSPSRWGRAARAGSSSSFLGRGARSSARPTSPPVRRRATPWRSSTRRPAPFPGRGSGGGTKRSSTRDSFPAAATRRASRRGRASTTTRPRTASRAWSACRG